MPRNNQGVYTLPAGNPVVPGTLIETTWANPTMSDIAAALTGSLPRDGSAPMTADLILANNTPSTPLSAASKAYVQSFMVYATGMPVGAAIPFLGNTPPPGFLVCNGQAVNRTTYAELFAVIGTIYGAGDGVLTFNVPDLRNQFIRGKADDRAVGSLQVGSFAAHTHPVSDPGHVHGVSGSQAAHAHTITTGSHGHGVSDPGHQHTSPYGLTAGPYSNSDNGGGFLETTNVQDSVSGTGISIQTAGNLGGSADSQQPAVTVSLASATTGETIGSTGGTETVPQNMALIYVVKAVNDTTQVGAVTSISSSDSNMIAIDSTNPAIPKLDIKSNVAFGTVKLDANNKVPSNLIETSTFQYLGPFDASGGQNPSQALPSEVFNNADLYQISVGGTIQLHDAAGVLSSTAVVAADQITYITGSTVGLPTGWYFQPSTTVSGVTAGAVSFVPTGTVSATNVQAAIAEVASESAPVEHVGAGGAQHANAVAAGAAGFMTGADKTKLNSVEAGAQVNTVGSVNGQTGVVVLDAADVGALTQAGADSLYVNVSGDTMSGGLKVGGTGLTFPDNTVQGTAATAPGPAFHATASAQQNLTVNVPTKIDFGTETFDTDNCYDTALARFTPNVAGYYQINMAAGNATTLDTFGIYTFINKNGVGNSVGSGSTGNASTFARGACSDVIYLNGATDYVEAFMSGTGPSGSVGCTGFQFSGALVRAA